MRHEQSSEMTPETNRILIAEDHYVSRHMLERNLENWGFRVTLMTASATYLVGLTALMAATQDLHNQ